jgi:DNA-binding transcriptional MerR regulator
MRLCNRALPASRAFLFRIMRSFFASSPSRQNSGNSGEIAKLRREGRDSVKSGELAKRLKVTDATIRDWSDRFDDLLSPSARRRPRVFSPEDVLLIATVRRHREQDPPTPLPEIRERLEKGERVTELPDLPDAALEEARSITAYKPKDAFDEVKEHLAELLAERNLAIERERAALQQIADLREQLGRLEGEKDRADQLAVWLQQAQQRINELEHHYGLAKSDNAWLADQIQKLQAELERKRGWFSPK